MYIQNQELVVYHKEYLETGIISEQYASRILGLARNLLNHPNFVNYPDDIKDDLVGHAMFRFMKGVKNAKVDGNLFAYYTQLCYFAFLEELRRIYNYENHKRKIAKDTLDNMQISAKDNEAIEELKEYLNNFKLNNEE